MSRLDYDVNNPSPQQVKAVRKRCWHYLEPSVAMCAGISVEELKQFCVGAIDLEPWQLHQLAVRTQIYAEFGTMSDDTTGTDLIRLALRARNSKVNLALFSRDLGLNADVTHNFIFNGADLTTQLDPKLLPTYRPGAAQAAHRPVQQEPAKPKRAGWLGSWV